MEPLFKERDYVNNSTLSLYQDSLYIGENKYDVKDIFGFRLRKDFASELKASIVGFILLIVGFAFLGNWFFWVCLIVSIGLLYTNFIPLLKKEYVTTVCLGIEDGIDSEGKVKIKNEFYNFPSYNRAIEFKTILKSKTLNQYLSLKND